MNFEDLLKLLEKGEGIANPLAGAIGSASGILNMLGIGRRRQTRQQKEMIENAAKINYKCGEMAAENAFERQQVLYNRTYQDQSYACLSSCTWFSSTARPLVTRSANSWELNPSFSSILPVYVFPPLYRPPFSITPIMLPSLS